MNILEGLNDKQYEAVKNTEGPNLIIAGAGSRKNKSVNTQNSVFNRRKRHKTMANFSNNIYK
ncbi:MAG: hypothetical protein Q4G09_05465 [Clostridia bacterium]|nr:hypothetical protein [Clostridia bacterium]